MSGSKGGAPKGNNNAGKAKQFENALKAALNKDRTALMQIMGTLIAKAIDGEGWAIKEIADRLDGKPKQAVDTTVNASDSIQALLEGIAANANRVGSQGS